MTTFSVTERGTYRTCREQWNNSSMNRLGLEPIVKSTALFMGTLWHATLADWEEDWDLDPAEKFAEYAELARDEMKDKYLSKYGRPPVLDDHDTIIELGHAMMANYRDYYKQPIPKGFTLVAAEQTIVIPVPDSEHCTRCWEHLDGFNGTCYTEGHQLEQHYLEGTLDGIIANDRGQIYVLEHKTYERRPSSSEMAMNDQFLAYLWITANMPGIDPAVGVLYNGAWKRPAPPKGKTFDDLFNRQFLLRSKPEIEDFGRQLTMEINEMGSPNTPIYMNRSWSTCTFCAFKDVCLGKSRDEDVAWLLDGFVPRDRTPAWRTPPPMIAA